MSRLPFTLSVQAFSMHAWLLYVALYIDQPIGTGFSHGTDPATGTESAAAAIWTVRHYFPHREIYNADLNTTIL